MNETVTTNSWMITFICYCYLCLCCFFGKICFLCFYKQRNEYDWPGYYDYHDYNSDSDSNEYAVNHLYRHKNIKYLPTDNV